MSGKGAAAEREVLRLIEAWWKKLEPEIEIARTPGSGGWHHAARWGAKADLMIRNSDRFPFAIEVKRREAWSDREFVAGRRSPVWKWWDKTCADALTIGPDRIPMLWIRRNRAGWIVIVPAAISWCRGRLVPSILWGWLDCVSVQPVAYHAGIILGSDPEIWALPV